MFQGNWLNGWEWTTLDLCKRTWCRTWLSFWGPPETFAGLESLRKLRGAEHAFAPRSYILLPGDFFRRSSIALFWTSKSHKLWRLWNMWRVEMLKWLELGSPATHQKDYGVGNFRPFAGNQGRKLISRSQMRWLMWPCPSLNAGYLKMTSSDRKPLSELEWIQIRSFDTQSSLESISTAQVERCRNTWSRVKDLMPERQASLLHRNFWALKPSCGQFGRGILLIDRLPEDPGQLLEWAAAVGRGGLKGGNDVKEGVVLQKLIEQPHLLDKQLLGNLGNLGNPAGDSVSGGKFKYNLRMIVLATLRSPCRIWLYNEGFVSLALCPFTSQLDPLSHITNLRQGAGYESQRRWPIRDLDSYLGS